MDLSGVVFTGTAAVVRRSAGLDCVSVSPLGSVVMPRSASFGQDGVNACVVSSSSFGGAAGFSVFFDLVVQEGSTQPALAKASPRSVAKSFLHVGDVIVPRQDTSRARV